MSKKSPKKSKALAVRPEPTVQELVNMFAGSSSLVQSSKRDERDLILRVAEAFAIPAVCVNIMGGLPYINKDGLLFKLEEYDGKQIVSLTTKMINYAKEKGERAIAEAELKLKDGRFFNAVGEADELSIKLDAVKRTPNMMAETRAQNRVIRKAIQAKMLRDLYTKLGGKYSPYSDEEKNIIQNAAQSSAEEMTGQDALYRAQEVRDPAPPQDNEQISREEMMKMSLDKIKKERNSANLTIFRENIEKKAGFYSPEEKKTLISAIAAQMKANVQREKQS